MIYDAMAAVASEEGTTRFNGKHILVTWSRSTIGDKYEFLEKLLGILPVGVRVFGGRELHADSTLSYHAMISFAEKMHWPDAAKKFSIEGDTNAIRLKKPKPRHPIRDFLERSVAYCARGGDVFKEGCIKEGCIGIRQLRPREEAKRRSRFLGEREAFKRSRSFLERVPLEREIVKREVGRGQQ